MILNEEDDAIVISSDEESQDDHVWCENCHKRCQDFQTLKAHLCSSNLCFISLTEPLWPRVTHSQERCRSCDKIFSSKLRLRFHFDQSRTCKNYYVEEYSRRLTSRKYDRVQIKLENDTNNNSLNGSSLAEASSIERDDTTPPVSPLRSENDKLLGNMHSEASTTRCVEFTTNLAGHNANLAESSTNQVGITTSIAGLTTNIAGLTTNIGGCDTNLTSSTTNCVGYTTNQTSAIPNLVGFSTNIEGSTINLANSETHIKDVTTKVAGPNSKLVGSAPSLASPIRNLANCTTNTEGSRTDQKDLTKKVAVSPTNLLGPSIYLVSSITKLANSITNLANSNTKLPSPNTKIADSNRNLSGSYTHQKDSTTKVAGFTTNLSGSTTNIASSSTNLASSSTNLASSSTNLARSTTNLAGLTKNVTGHTTHTAGPNTHQLDSNKIVAGYDTNFLSSSTSLSRDTSNLPGCIMNSKASSTKLTGASKNATRLTTIRSLFNRQLAGFSPNKTGSVKSKDGVSTNTAGFNSQVTDSLTQFASSSPERTGARINIVDVSFKETRVTTNNLGFTTQETGSIINIATSTTKESGSISNLTSSTTNVINSQCSPSGHKTSSRDLLFVSQSSPTLGKTLRPRRSENNSTCLGCGQHQISVQDHLETAVKCRELVQYTQTISCLNCKAIFSTEEEKTRHFIHLVNCQKFLREHFENRKYITYVAICDNFELNRNMCPFCTFSADDGNVFQHVLQREKCRKECELAVVRFKLNLTSTEATITTRSPATTQKGSTYRNRKVSPKNKRKRDKDAAIPTSSHLYCFFCQQFLRSAQAVMSHPCEKTRLLSRHWHRKASWQNYQCLKCRKFFDQVYNLEKHMYTHEKKSSRLFRYVATTSSSDGPHVRSLSASFDASGAAEPALEQSVNTSCSERPRVPILKLSINAAAGGETSRIPSWSNGVTKAANSIQSRNKRPSKYIKLTSSVKNIRCQKCGRNFHCQQVLQLHILTSSDCLEQYEHSRSWRVDGLAYCFTCKRSFVNEDVFLSHYCVGVVSLRLECAMCPRRFRGIERLMSHENRKHKRNNDLSRLQNTDGRVYSFSDNNEPEDFEHTMHNETTLHRRVSTSEVVGSNPGQDNPDNTLLGSGSREENSDIDGFEREQLTTNSDPNSKLSDEYRCVPCGQSFPSSSLWIAHVQQYHTLRRPSKNAR